MESISRARSAPAEAVIRAKILLAVAQGMNYTQAARSVGRKSNDAVSALVSRFNQEGLEALLPRHGGGFQAQYGGAEKARILREFERQPELEQDGTATWSLITLQPALREAADGLPRVSTYTILDVLHEAGYNWQRNRSWNQTGQAVRKRKAGKVIITDPDTEAKKNMIERAYTLAKSMGIAVWCEDEAGPYGTVPYAGASWRPEGQPAQYSHEYFRDGTAKMMTLFHPQTGEVRVKGVTNTRNETLHRWLKEELTAILVTLPEPAAVTDPQTNRLGWESWREGVTVKATLSADLPPLRLLLVMDNLTGHKNADWLIWCFQRGILSIFTPLGGSCLNMAESIQRILKRRALVGFYPQEVHTIIVRLETVARRWNTRPTPFVWNGKRRMRRQRARAKSLHRVGSSGAATPCPIERLDQWRRSRQWTY